MCVPLIAHLIVDNKIALALWLRDGPFLMHTPLGFSYISLFTSKHYHNLCLMVKHLHHVKKTKSLVGYYYMLIIG